MRWHLLAPDMETAVTGRSSWIAAAAIIALFAMLQLLGVDYGTQINDIPHIANYRLSSDVLRGSSLERDAVVDTPADRMETLDLAMLRFKLYSIEADEIVNIMALARINPSARRFDPGFYQYGGAYLYPLGAWYYLLSRIGLIETSFDKLIADPQLMDQVWIWGRIFVLLAFIASSAVLWATLSLLAPPRVVLILLATYLICPASIMFSQVLKPHWYALLWVNGALWFLVRGFARGSLGRGTGAALAVTIGLAVGSALTFMPFAIAAWGALLGAAARGLVRSAALLRVPLIAGAVFVTTNPYYLINARIVLSEGTTNTGWFRASLDPAAVAAFIDNSLFTGLGVALTILLLAAALIHLVRGDMTARLIAATLLVCLLMMAVVTSSMAAWHVNLRYVAYALPVGLLLLSAYPWRGRTATLGVVLALTATQALPLKLAYFDENDPAHSTRQRAGAWIGQNISTADTICLHVAAPSPYDVPPLQLDRYTLRERDCRWTVRVERETDSARAPSGYALAQRFRPRLSPERFPLVFGHINPQISIYLRE